MIKEQIKKIKERITPKRRNIIFIILAIAIIISLLGCYFLLGDSFGRSVWVVFTAILGIVLLAIMLMAGLAVLKSLFFVAAELSLLIFLSQSYCDIPNRSIASNGALKNLLAIGLLYITVNFCISLYKELKESYMEVRKGEWSKRKIFNIVLFIIFTIFFMWQIYLIVTPIIFNLCVYK
jgi:hypothetical protein